MRETSVMLTTNAKTALATPRMKRRLFRSASTSCASSMRSLAGGAAQRRAARPRGPGSSVCSFTPEWFVDAFAMTSLREKLDLYKRREQPRDRLQRRQDLRDGLVPVGQRGRRDVNDIT